MKDTGRIRFTYVGETEKYSDGTEGVGAGDTRRERKCGVGKSE